jgi:hypothetical protein
MYSNMVRSTDDRWESGSFRGYWVAFDCPLVELRELEARVGGDDSGSGCLDRVVVTFVGYIVRVSFLVLLERLLRDEEEASK